MPKLSLPALALAALLALLALPAASAAAAADCRLNRPERLQFGFCGDSGGWVGDFADLPTADRDTSLYALSFRRLPVPGTAGRLWGLRLSGHNRSDDLFLFVKRQLTGLRPRTRYRVDVAFTLASSAGRGCFGVGGSPGESVYLKAGATTQEPRARDVEGYLELNLDKGNQSEGGRDAVVVGDLATEGADCDGSVWATKRLRTRPGQLRARTDKDGNLWVLIGADSGFEGLNRFYLTEIRLRLRAE